MESVHIKDPSGDVAHVDHHTGYLVTISEIHAQIHDGQFFSCNEVDTSLANTGSITLLIDTDGGVPHARITAAAGGDARLEIYEAPTVSANGTACSVINRNRLSANTNTSDVYSGPTVSANGTKIFDIIVPGGTGGNSTGGSSGLYEEFILATSTLYLVKVTNIAGQTKPVSVTVDFYEL